MSTSENYTGDEVKTITMNLTTLKNKIAKYSTSSFANIACFWSKIFSFACDLLYCSTFSYLCNKKLSVLKDVNEFDLNYTDLNNLRGLVWNPKSLCWSPHCRQTNPSFFKLLKFFSEI